MIGLLESLRDPEVVQHRLFALMPLLFGAFEWCVRTGRLRSRAAAQVFPLVCAGGGALLLTHNHTIANVKDALLIEFTHTPLALASIAAGWARWLELRLPARAHGACGGLGVAVVFCGDRVVAGVLSGGLDYGIQSHNLLVRKGGSEVMTGVRL